MIGTGRASDRDVVLGLGARAFVDTGDLGQVGGVDVAFDVIGGEVLERPAELVRPAAGRAGRLLRRRTEPCPTGRTRRTGENRPAHPIVGAVFPPSETAAASASARWSRLSRSSAQPPGRRGAWDRWAPRRAAPG
ncbi:hypothetical protein [Herbidospora cretacea]|uniref:hypothetical protein n=1 Tax=Herbidospora cretacea TaxID=28444 RepID=UPI003AFB68BC